MAPRPDVSEERRQQILDAATKVFSRKGFDDARMDDIAEQAGLSKGTLYWYFKSKADLVYAIIDRIFQHGFQQAEALAGSDATASDCIRQFVEINLDEVRTMMHLMPVAYEFLALAFRNTFVQRALKDYFQSYMDALVPMIQRGIDLGEFRPVEAMEVAIATGAIFEGTILLWVYDKTRVDPVRNARAGIELLLAGIRA
jgi:AcrR family transcriptional regulator